MPIFRRSQAEIREAGGRASGLTVLDPRRTMDREMETRQLAEIASRPAHSKKVAHRDGEAHDPIAKDRPLRA